MMIVRRAETAREVTDGHARAVDLAIVAREEEIHGRVVGYEGLVNDPGAGAGDAP